MCVSTAGWRWIGAGVIALGAYGFVAAFQSDPHFGRVLAAYGGVFIAGSLLWGMVADGFRPDRWDVTGALVAWLVGVGVIMWGDTRCRARTHAHSYRGWLRFHSTPADAGATVGGGDRGPGAREMADPPVRQRQQYRRMTLDVDGGDEFTRIERDLGRGR